MDINTMIYHIKPIKFWPYTSIVTDRIIDIEYGPKDYEIQRFEKNLIEKFNDNKIKSVIDNKIVFECEINGKKIFYGFKDWTFSIGFGIEGDYI